jgi:predicted DNA-binding transcriptional regulator YafY
VFVADRLRTVRRHWRILLLLRTRPHTIHELVNIFRVSLRTMRRDMGALEALFPIRVEAGSRGNPSLYALPPLPQWPRHEVAPIADLPDRRA